MIKKLFGGAAVVIQWICIGTVITQVVLVTVLYAKGALTPAKRQRIGVILSGTDLEELRQETLVLAQQQEADTTTQNTMEDFVRRQREEQVEKGIDYIESMRSGITRERERYDIIKTDFSNRLDSMETTGRDISNAVLMQTLEAMKPKQAKDQIVRMINDNGMDEAAVIMHNMSDASRKKIFDEFKLAGDELRLHELIMKIREQQRAQPPEEPTPGEEEN